MAAFGGLVELIAFLSFVGIPPLAGFAGKLGLFSAARRGCRTLGDDIRHLS
jgi:NADH:ubiquinone oxidoreductase subunit 2 (subunit N)